MATTLDAYLGLSQPNCTPECIATSQEIRDRGSTFVASIYAASNDKEARAVVACVRNVVHASKPATHEVSAWRCMVLKEGKTGLGGPDDFELKTGSEDDREQHAGGKVLKVMQEEGVIDAVVIVSRWYGGVMLGPVRFAHFETCARDVCRVFRLKDDMATSIARLSSLDDTLTSLRAELASLTKDKQSMHEQSESTLAPQDEPKLKKAPDYITLKESLDINKAKRLIAARENAIRVVKNALRKKRDTAVG
ncbi:ribosomal protein S5 domain 2-like protein [Laetiporus sulphureus 93-53]|uniref:Ribosomal protein S5 domain 2-like protein n=1 Tax=Laetiporus sulphureus 93-53 TaxID=1314785 RepID=A0A165DQ91_9APHY|nr:ribosomal protein S5 domain 2-like protein [Laetiporus sulphureus 93-53]KZT05388.1 ribosomal protein S5 domain 2-like protein [Laetiporus sulphureus 93-53]